MPAMRSLRYLLKCRWALSGSRTPTGSGLPWTVGAGGPGTVGQPRWRTLSNQLLALNAGFYVSALAANAEKARRRWQPFVLPRIGDAPRLRATQIALWRRHALGCLALQVPGVVRDRPTVEGACRGIPKSSGPGEFFGAT